MSKSNKTKPKKQKIVISPEPIMECVAMIKNIVTDSITILQRKDRDQTMKLLTLTMEFNEKLEKLNQETIEMLEDESWREPKK